MHILAAQRKLSRPTDLPRMYQLKKSDSSCTFETLTDESSSSWDASEKPPIQDDEKCEEDLNEMIDMISREVARELAKSVRDDDGSESVSSGSSTESPKLDAHSIASSLLLLCREGEENIWDLELDDVIADDDNVSELDYEASEFENNNVPGISENRIVERVQESTKVKPVEMSPHHFTVTFDKITVREYGIVLGDNPACRCGPSVSIGWEYDEFPALQLDDFESIREGNRRTKRGMLMDRSYRVRLLKRLGYSESDIIDAFRANKKVRQARLQTLSKGIVKCKIANVSRTLQGFMSRRTSPSI